MRADVVLLPGFHGSAALFDDFVSLAPPWARCRAVHLPIGTEQTFEVLAGSLVHSLRSLEGIVLLGESFSAPIAARISSLLGSKVALLVLCNPLVTPRFQAPVRPACSVVRSRWLTPWTVALTMAGGDRSIGAAVVREVRRLPERTVAARLSAVFSATRAEIGPYVSAPLLTILGTRDLVVASSHARALAKGVPFSTLVEIPAPHLVVQTEPAEVWKAINEEFLGAA